MEIIDLHPDYIVSTSWGKDSVAMMRLVVDAHPAAHVRHLRLSEMERFPDTDGVRDAVLSMPAFAKVRYSEVRVPYTWEAFEIAGGPFVSPVSDAEKAAWSATNKARSAFKEALASGVGSPGAFIGLRGDESRARAINRAMRGDSYIKANGTGVSQPMSRMTGDDIWAIHAAHDLPCLYIYDVAKNRDRARSEVTLAHPAGGAVVANGEPALWVKAYPDFMDGWFSRWPELRQMLCLT